MLHAHVSEGTYEPEHALKNFGMRTLPYYDQLGVAGDGFLASQCVQIDPEEIALMAERGVRMTHMPLSNCEVGGGIAPVPELVEAGVTVGLGSDGYVDDFFEVMRGAFLIHKAKHQNPQVMPAHLVWYLATEGGAKALGLKKLDGSKPAGRLICNSSTLICPLRSRSIIYTSNYCFIEMLKTSVVFWSLAM